MVRINEAGACPLWGLTVLVLGFVLVTGCSTLRAIFVDRDPSSMQAGETEPTDTKNVSAAQTHRARAAILEQQGELQLAVSCLRVAKALDPEVEGLGVKIEALQATCRREAEKHLDLGIKRYHQNQRADARRHFLSALRYDPDNQKALNYLKQQLLPSSYQSYKVNKGDTLKQVAKKVYQDPGKDFLIAYFNDLKPGQEPPAGSWLKLPHLEAEFAEPYFDIQGELALARRYLAQERYGDVLGITGKILDYDYLNKEADELKNAAYYQMGLRLLRQEKYEAAVQMLGKVGPEQEGLATALQQAHAQELRRAENLLQERAFDPALSSAQRVLMYDPSNPEAGDLINRILCRQGQLFIEGQKYREALAVLGKGDPTHDCVAANIAAVKVQLGQQAEAHYLQGVKYFLNEDLQHAITEWETALALNPEHEKARRGIENARHLLEQLDKVEKK